MFLRLVFPTTVFLECALLLGGYLLAAENPGVVTIPFPDHPDSKIIGLPRNTMPDKTRPGRLTIEGVLYDVTINPSRVSTLRPDIFKSGYFSVFDALVRACKQYDVDIKFHFDRGLRSYVIDSIAGKRNWWYAAIYDGGSRPEEPVHRMGSHPYKDLMKIEIYQVPKERIDEIYDSFRSESKRLEANWGKVVVPEVTIRTPNQNLKFNDVEVKAHGTRSDMFQPGVITAADIMFSLAEQGKLSVEMTWLEKLGRALVQGYYFTRFNQEKAEGRAGFTYSLGEKKRYLHRSRPGGFGNNNFHMTVDIRVIVSPQYISWRWTNLGRSRKRTPSAGR